MFPRTKALRCTESDYLHRFAQGSWSKERNMLINHLQYRHNITIITTLMCNELCPDNVKLHDCFKHQSVYLVPQEARHAIKFMCKTCFMPFPNDSLFATHVTFFHPISDDCGSDGDAERPSTTEDPSCSQLQTALDEPDTPNSPSLCSEAVTNSPVMRSVPSHPIPCQRRFFVPMIRLSSSPMAITQPYQTTTLEHAYSNFLELGQQQSKT